MTTPVDLAADRIDARLHTRSLGRSLDVRGSTASTMDDARRVASTAAAGHVVVADTQTAGRGTHGRTWLSPSGVDLYLTAVVRPNVELADLGPLTLAVGIGVAEALDAFVDSSRVRIKWPNDVFVDGRKCAGILVESRSLGDRLESVLVGIGVNVNRREFESDVRASATSLALAADATLDRADVLARVLDSVERAIDRFENEGARGIARAVDARLFLRGSRVRLDELEGTLIGVDTTGGVLVGTESGVVIRLAGRLEPL